MHTKMIYYRGCYFQEAYACLQLGLRREAEAFYLKSAAADSGVMEAFYHLGLMKFQEKKYSQSLGYFRKALILKPGNGAIQNMISKAELEINRA